MLLTENRQNRALFTRPKNSPASQTLATARMAPKICRGQTPTMYSECSRFHPNRFTFGGVIAERVNTAKLPRKVNRIFGRSLSSSRILNTTSSKCPGSTPDFRWNKKSASTQSHLFNSHATLGLAICQRAVGIYFHPQPLKPLIPASLSWSLSRRPRDTSILVVGSGERRLSRSISRTTGVLSDILVRRVSAGVMSRHSGRSHLASKWAARRLILYCMATGCRRLAVVRRGREVYRYVGYSVIISRNQWKRCCWD